VVLTQQIENTVAKILVQLLSNKFTVLTTRNSVHFLRGESGGCEHTRILGALVEHPQGNLEEIQQENPEEHPRGTCRPSGPQGLDVRHRALRSQPRTASADAGGAIRTPVPVASPPRPPPKRANVPTYDSWGKSRL
jgi:hypothetical protein